MTVTSEVGRQATYVGPDVGGLPTGTRVTVISITLGAVPLAVVKIPSGHSSAVQLDQVLIDERT